MAAADSSERIWSATTDELVDISVADYSSAIPWSRGFYVGVSGDVNLILEGSTVAKLYKGMAAGVEHSLSVKTVVKTGGLTTATNMILLR